MPDTKYEPADIEIYIKNKARDMTANQSGKPADYDIVIMIAKYVPERYVSEAVGDILQYARRKGMSADQVTALLREQL